MNIFEIRAKPTLFKDAQRGMSHESVLKSFQILQHVKGMLKRGDSHQTILEVIEVCEKDYPPTNSLSYKKE